MPIKHLLTLVPFIILSVKCLGQENDDDDFNTYGHANVTASRLAGTWTTNLTLSARLAPDKKLRQDTVIFEVDSSALKLVLSRIGTRLKTKTIFLSGFMVSRGIRYPFVLVENHGNTHLIFFRDKNGKKYEDGESFNLFIAVSNKKEFDLLCTGGDFNNEPFRTWDRIK